MKGIILLLAAIAASGETLVELDNPFGLTVGPDGALYVCEVGKGRIVRVALDSRKVTTVAEGLKEPYELVFDNKGDLYFVERLNHSVGRVDVKTGAVITVAGNGVAGFGGDGGPAVKAQLNQPHSLVFGSESILLICDILNRRIRSLDLGSGMIDTWAGPLDGPRALARNKAGNFYLALREGNAVYSVDAQTRKMTRFAGTGEKGYSGDGETAVKARLSGPKGVACAPDGTVYIADTENHAIRKVDASGVIGTLATPPLKRPHGVFIDAKGAIYISDTENNRVLLLH